MEPRGQFLRRYTNLADAIHILKTRKMALRDPRGWDDKNDAHYMEVFRKRMNAKAVRALCFTSSEETYHHWRIYASGYDGVCFVLKHEEFVDRASRSLPGLQAQFVQYEYVTNLQGRTIAPSSLPFLKRKAFSGEDEFRFVFCDCSTTDATNVKGNGGADTPLIAFDVATIDRIVLSPWLHSSLVSTMRETLRDLAGVTKLRVDKSKLVDYKRWRNFAVEPISAEAQIEQGGTDVQT